MTSSTEPVVKREIKFRFYDKKTHKLLSECNMWWNYIEYLNGDDVIVCQFTGLLDRNGKDIYEGDIVTYTGMDKKTHNGVVEYISDRAHFGLRIKSGWSTMSSESSIRDEVIGNIYENKDLLALNKDRSNTNE